MQDRRAILLSAPHLVTAMGNPISFSTDMEAPLTIPDGALHCGKNLLNTAAEHIAWGYFTSSGGINADEYEICTLDYIRVYYQSSITISSSTYGTLQITLYDVNKSFLTRKQTSSPEYSHTFYIDNSSAKYIRFNYCPKPNRKHSSLSQFSAYNLQAEYGPSATHYEPFALISNSRTAKGVNNIWDGSDDSIAATYWIH